MAVSSTTKMMNLLTLVLVMLPGLSLSFSNTNPWRELYERVQASADNPPPPLGRYVCCNNPGTIPPDPRTQFPHRGLFLSLSKRDDRDAPYRKAVMEAAGESPWNTAGNGRAAEGRFPGRDAARGRDSLLASILNVLRSSGAQRPSRYGRAAGSRLGDFGDSAYVTKRGHEDGRVFTGKRTFGEIGGPNMDWEE